MVVKVSFKVQEWKDAGIWTDKNLDIPDYDTARHILGEFEFDFPHMQYRIVRVTEEFVL